ncbi:hypothetical protein ACFL4N_03775 [Thermodesulfobacteriota bacterium]
METHENALTLTKEKPAPCDCEGLFIAEGDPYTSMLKKPEHRATREAAEAGPAKEAE